MHFMPLRNLKISSATILCSLIGTAFSASLFRLDFSPYDKDDTTGYERMSPNINSQNNHQQKSNSNYEYGSISPFSYTRNDNFYQPNFRTPMRSTPTPIDFMNSFKMESELPLNQSMHHDNQNRDIDTIDKKDSHRSLHNKDDFGNSIPIEQTNQKTRISEEADDYVTLGWSDFDTDNTTETSDYEILGTIVTHCAASPVVDGQAKPQVLRYEMETADMPNSYNFYYDTSDGSSRTEHGAILNPGTKDAALDVFGTVRWYDNKGQLYEMSYKAGKRGYRTVIKKVYQR